MKSLPIQLVLLVAGLASGSIASAQSATLTAPFGAIKPIKTIYVSPTGNNANPGTDAAKPKQTITAAMTAASAGTAIRVKAGTYKETVRVKSGTSTAPIWLISADGKGAAKINAKGKGDGIYGWGADNVIIDGFDITADNYGIVFGMANGTTAAPSETSANSCLNIVVRNNTVHDVKIDGIKFSQSVGVWILDNTVHHTGEQGIDNVAVNNLSIARNNIYTTVRQGIVAKGGSKGVTIQDNDISGAGTSGINAGEWSDEKWMWAAARTEKYEAKNVLVKYNSVNIVSQLAVSTMACHYCTIDANKVRNNAPYYADIGISYSTANHATAWPSKYAVIRNNCVGRTAFYKYSVGSEVGKSVSNNTATACGF